MMRASTPEPVSPGSAPKSELATLKLPSLSGTESVKEKKGPLPGLAASSKVSSAAVTSSLVGS